MPYLIVENDSSFVDQVQNVTGRSNEHLQRELRRIVFSIQCPDYVLVNCLLSEKFLERVFDQDTMQNDSWIVRSSLSALDQLGWFSMAIDSDADRMLFLCDPSNAKWIDQLREVITEVC